ncbi:uncharacterized protein LOC111269780 isoform X3 [Varroa jacobsoni]|uniref:uncharacterized protein LOC111269780 isoform X3 n=1 Tax=Varroa jacobsoni TaxID=62625 RepID=UPI000BF752F6|nr:uncharacterized protein LOC111269780 isoform X3 [Varroa jacobsoni]
MDELGILDDGLLLVDGVNEFLEENPRNSSHEMVEVLSTTVESASESTDSDETVNSVQSNEIWSRCAGNGNATNEVGEESRKNLYEGKYRIERETLLSTDRERGFLTAIFGSANLHKLWFPIKPDQLPSTEDALSNYLIENLIPTELNRFFAPAAWCQLKTLVERQREELVTTTLPATRSGRKNSSIENLQLTNILPAPTQSVTVSLSRSQRHVSAYT